MLYAERADATVYHPTVCLSVTFRYRDHIGWNTLQIILPPNSLRSLLTSTYHFLQSADKDQQEMRAVAEKAHDAVVKFDTYRN